jgi:hypothetical protein
MQRHPAQHHWKLSSPHHRHPCRVQKLTTNTTCEKPRDKGYEKPNRVRNQMEKKPLKLIERNGSLSE